MKRKVLIAGASGVVGRAALDILAAIPDTEVIGISRRPPDAHLDKHYSLDLADRAACEAMLGGLTDITHLIYAALFEQPGLFAGWRDEGQMQTNLTMLKNCLEPLGQAAKGLRQVHLLQGTKAYGAHLRPMKVPGKEREPRVEHENFYWLQEDWLKAASAAANWNWTIWRPPVIFGHAIGAPMNVLAAIGTYAAIEKAYGRGLAFPGGASGIMDGVDARLLARAFAWAMDNDEAQNQTFNLTNGDVFVWENIWPSIALAMDMAPAPPRPLALASHLAGETDLWRRLATQHSLCEPNLVKLIGDSPIYADMLLGYGQTHPFPPSLLSDVKIRQAGFHECLDTEQMVIDWLRRLRAMKLLP